MHSRARHTTPPSSISLTAHTPLIPSLTTSSPASPLPLMTTRLPRMLPSEAAASVVERQLFRTLFWRCPNFAPLSVLHSLAIMHKVGSVAARHGGVGDGEGNGSSSRSRSRSAGVSGFHLHRVSVRGAKSKEGVAWFCSRW